MWSVPLNVKFRKCEMPLTLPEYICCYHSICRNTFMYNVIYNYIQKKFLEKSTTFLDTFICILGCTHEKLKKDK